jgi:hypothetical protein
MPNASNMYDSTGGTATSGGGSASRGEAQGVRDAYDAKSK